MGQKDFEGWIQKMVNKMKIKPMFCGLQEAFPSFETRNLYPIEVSNRLGFVYLINEMASAVSQDYFCALTSLDRMPDYQIAANLLAFSLQKDIRDVSIFDEDDKESFLNKDFPLKEAIILRTLEDTNVSYLTDRLQPFCRKIPLKIVFINRIDLLTGSGSLRWSFAELQRFAEKEDLCIIGTGFPNSFHGIVNSCHVKSISTLDEYKKIARISTYCENLSLKNFSDFYFNLENLQIKEILPES